MTSELITAPVGDVSHDLHLIARNGAEMQQAQASLVAWFAGKVAICERDVQEAEENLRIAKEGDFKTKGFSSALRKARGRLEYYHKLAAAVEAGYCIVPNFPVELFAIRTSDAPAIVESRWRGDAEGQRPSEGPPIGLGYWVDSRPESMRVATYDDKGERKEKHRTTDWSEEIEFPVSIAKPEIMSAACAAMAGEFFDELGVLPHTGKRKGDPILVGRIRKPGQKPYAHDVSGVVTFMIAWYVNPAEL